jgi:hypothetical protein
MKKSKKTPVAAKNVKVEETFSLPPVVSEASPTAVLGDSLPMKDEDAASVRAIENQILQTKLALADLALQVLEADRQRGLLAAQIREQHDNLMAEVKRIAESYGIDVEGTRDQSKWNLDTASMVFTRVSQ